MGIEISNPGGGGITIETDPLALLKTGGIMAGNIRFDEVGIQSIGKGTFDAGRGAYNGISLICANDVELNWQAGYLKAKYNGSDVPINSEVPFNIYSYTEEVYEEGELVEPAYTRTLALSGTGISHTDGQYSSTFSINAGGFSAYNGQSNEGVSFNSGGLTFGDGTVQTTAFGGIINGGLVVNNDDGSPIFTVPANSSWPIFGNPDDGVYTEISNDWLVINGQKGGTTGTVILGRNYEADDSYGIKFYDGSYQTTAGGYLGTSTSSNTVDSGNGKSFTTQKHLLYTPYQKIVIVATGTSNHMHGQVVSYSKTTGELVFDADTHSGSGTHTDWTINVGG